MSGATATVRTGPHLRQRQVPDDDLPLEAVRPEGEAFVIEAERSLHGLSREVELPVYFTQRRTVLRSFSVVDPRALGPTSDVVS